MSTSSHPSIYSLIKLARTGSRSKLGDLLERYRPLLMGLASRQIGSRLQIRLSRSDLVQETLLTASQAFPRFRGDSSEQFQAWLCQILKARLRDGLRRHMLAEKRIQGRDRSGLSSLLIDQGDTPSRMAVLNEQSAKLSDAIIALDDTDRIIVLLRYEERLGFAQISEQVGLPLTAVWRRWSKAIERLRDSMQS